MSGNGGRNAFWQPKMMVAIAFTWAALLLVLWSMQTATKSYLGASTRQYASQFGTFPHFHRAYPTEEQPTRHRLTITLDNSLSMFCPRICMFLHALLPDYIQWRYVSFDIDEVDKLQLEGDVIMVSRSGLLYASCGNIVMNWDV
jgi:hypothetical protein